MSVVTRFAPSPTGMLHIGGARTAFGDGGDGFVARRIDEADEAQKLHTLFQIGEGKAFGR